MRACTHAGGPDKHGADAECIAIDRITSYSYGRIGAPAAFEVTDVRLDGTVIRSSIDREPAVLSLTATGT